MPHNSRGVKYIIPIETLPAPAPAIGVIDQDDAGRAEARRIGQPLASLLSELIALGWRCHVEDLREAAQ